jgi:hypothetical protein
VKQGIQSRHFSDDKGRPEGGHTFGTGFAIAWQRGPLGRGEERIPPNGAFVEDVLDAVIDRIEFYQASEFHCVENSDALASLKRAAKRLDDRTMDREARAVEGTHAK